MSETMTEHKTEIAELEKLLEDLELRIDPDVEDDIRSKWKVFVDGEFTGEIFNPGRKKKAPSSVEWPELRINDALESYEKMAMHQLSIGSNMLADGSAGILAVRCNYGTGIMPSLYGAEKFIMDDKYNTLPTTRPFDNGAEDIEKIVEAGMPDLMNGYGKDVFEMGAFYRDAFAKYPKIQKYVHIYHSDMQGPMDILELLWGSGIFVDLILKPELVHKGLELITDTYIEFMNKWYDVVGSPEGEYSVHWNRLQKGEIMLRDDSAMNLSPDMYEEFIKPCNQRLLTEFNGGSIHFCGRGDHFIESLSSMDQIYAVNLSQPDYNDMEVIFRNTVDKDIQMIGLGEDGWKPALDAGRDLHGNVESP